MSSDGAAATVMPFGAGLMSSGVHAPARSEALDCAQVAGPRPAAAAGQTGELPPETLRQFDRFLVMSRFTIGSETP